LKSALAAATTTATIPSALSLSAAAATSSLTKAISTSKS
jgi:hypothetical protein